MSDMQFNVKEKHWEPAELIKTGGLAIKIAIATSRFDKQLQNTEMTWDAFCARVGTTIRTAETAAEYPQLKKEQQAAIKDVGGFVAGHLDAGRRKKGCVLSRSMIVLDMDDGVPGFWEKLVRPHNYTCCAYSTHKHTPAQPRIRLVIPLRREISEAEYPVVARMVAQDIGSELFDDTTYEPQRLMYWPSTSADAPFFFEQHDGALLDPDLYLSRTANQPDAPTSPRSSLSADALYRAAAQAADPLTRPGLIGAFNRAYPVAAAIAAFLPDIYAPAGTSSRYDYLPANSSAGIVIYEGRFAYSHHATDPACGQLMHAFDLIRCHRFGHLDDQLSSDTPLTKRPSYQAMSATAAKDDQVKRLLVQERQARADRDLAAAGDDPEWQQKLEYEARSTALKNNLRNLTLILQNDPNLKALVFNLQLDGMEIKGDVPWRHPSKYWRDADDAQLVSYVDSHYGTFSQRNYQIAVTKVTDDRSYHPIREYLETLPPWDQVFRLDTLLIDYLGAEDNAYVRAVTRKTLCAAISRVQNPGCKFDSMLVLSGPQGIGKSTLIARLAGEWFSDSLNLNDTKDKTAAEKLQGYWILEIGELAGLRKTEIETLRSFLSRQNDIYRAAFGKRATPHLRQCIFFGTTNAESGYLRDTTGNRRFWPVKTPGGGSRHSWALADADVKQIWAESLVAVNAGETLYLDAAMDQLAKVEQREALESDERGGLVRDYLETLLPEDWPTMDLFERQNFLSGTAIGGIKRVGQTPRKSVCNMEIWCECFGKERANLKRFDSTDLNAILSKLGWQRLPDKIRTPLYGPQYIFVPKDCS